MKTKTGLFLAIAAAVLSFVANSEKKEIIKTIVSNSFITSTK